MEQGAATSVRAVVGTEWMRRGGVYLEDVSEAGLAEVEGPPYRTGYGPRRISRRMKRGCGN